MRSSIQSRRCSSPSPQSRHWRTHRLIRWYDPTASSSTMRFRGVGMAVLPLSKPRRRGYRRIRGNLDQAAETQVGGCPRLPSPFRRRKLRSVGVPDSPPPDSPPATPPRLHPQVGGCPRLHPPSDALIDASIGRSLWLTHSRSNEQNDPNDWSVVWRCESNAVGFPPDVSRPSAANTGDRTAGNILEF